MTIKIAVKVAYFNTLENTHGFQIQPNIETIEGFIIAAISKTNLIDKEIFRLDYAGRTDQGVNALSQVISFDLSEKYEKIPDRMLFQINKYLPKNIRCWAYTPVSQEFNPRFLAIERTYMYIWHEPKIEVLDLNEIKKSAEILIGEHNFANFSKKDDPNQITIRKLNCITVEKNDSVLLFELKAQSFLWQQCRRIVSHLIQIGKYEVNLDETRKLLEIFSMSEKPYPLPPQNLILTDIKYSEVSFITETVIIKKVLLNLKSLLHNKRNETSLIEKYIRLFSKSIDN